MTFCANILNTYTYTIIHFQNKKFLTYWYLNKQKYIEQKYDLIMYIV